MTRLKTCACGEPTTSAACSLCQSDKGLFEPNQYPETASPNDTKELVGRIAQLEAELITQTNRAASAEQQLTAMTQRWGMANALNTEARAQLAQRQVPADGWVIVPREPTREMCVAGARAAIKGNDAPYHVYAAMLAASPTQWEPLTDA